MRPRTSSAGPNRGVAEPGRVDSPCWVAEVTAPGHITADTLEASAIPPGGDPPTAENPQFQPMGAEDGSLHRGFRGHCRRWRPLAGRSRRPLVGVDYLSVAPYDDGVPTHQILLGAGVIAVEGLNLLGIDPGQYQLICLPLKITGSDGAPVRAVLMRISLHTTREQIRLTWLAACAG